MKRGISRWRLFQLAFVLAHLPTLSSRMKEYAELGIETFILSGYPHLEESYRFAELVFPLLPGRQRTSASGPLSGPFGEIVGNNYAPKASQS